MKPFSAASALLVCAGLGVGCNTLMSTVQSISVPGMRQDITEEELHAEVGATANRFSASLSTTADAIALGTRDVPIRRKTLVWKINLIPVAQRAAAEPNAAAGLLGLLTLATAQRRYLVEGDGRDLFGEQQGLARDMAVQVEREIEATVARILPPADAERLNNQVEQLARENPIRGVFMVGTIQSAVITAQQTGSFDWLLTAPMAPFRALQGVESGAVAIHEFNTTARQLGNIAAALPEETRWQLELFLYDVEERQTMIAGLAAFQKLADASALLSTTAAELPANTRHELEGLLEDSSASQADLRSTLEQLRQTIASTDGAIANARPLAQSLERFAAQADQAGKSWTDLIAALKKPDDKPEGSPPSRPFDIMEYEKTAAQLQSTASELRALVAELQGGGGTSLLNALLWRAVVFVAACAALVLGYRALAARIAPRRS